MRSIGLVLLLVAFPTHAAWPPATEITIVTGQANTNSSFTNEEGKPLEIEFETPFPAKTWKDLTETGPAHVSLIGSIKGDVFKVFVVEKFIEDKAERENSIGALRFQAAQGWATLTNEIAKNTAWIGTIRRTDSFVGGTSNSLSLLMMGNFIEYLITSTKDRELLNALISVSKLAENGVKETQIKPYFSAVTELMKLAASNVKERRREGSCSDLVALGDYEIVLVKLERLLAE